MMTVYISTLQHQEVLGFLKEERALEIQKITGRFSFANFCLKDMRKMGHAQYMAVEVSALEDKPEAFLRAVSSFELQYTARLIFLLSPKQAAMGTELHKLGQHNIVMLTPDVANVQNQIRECFSLEGMSKPAATALVEAPPPLVLKRAHREVLAAGALTVYISTPERQEVFGFLKEESALEIQKLTGCFSFSTFCLKDMRKMGHAQYVAVELSALKDKPDAFLRAVSSFELQYTARLIFLLSLKQAALRAQLHELGQHNIVMLTSDEADIQNQIRECFSLEGMSKPAVPVKTPPPLVVKRSCMEVLVAGAQSRVGTTGVALQMVASLSGIGIYSAYVEANGSGHLEKIMAATGSATAIDGGWALNGAQYLKAGAELAEDVEVAVFDIGVLHEGNLSAFLDRATDIPVLVGRTMPHELEYVYAAKQQLTDADVQLVLTDVPAHQQSRLTTILEKKTALYISPHGRETYGMWVRTGKYGKRQKLLDGIDMVQVG